MEPELEDILRTVATDPIGDSHTHFTLYGPYARWTVSTYNQTDFWSRYCELVNIKIKLEPFANMCLAERPQQVMPQITKLTFRFQGDMTDDNLRPYDEEFLQWVCHTYQTVLCEYFETTQSQMELLVAVLESNSHWYEKDNETGKPFMVLEIRLQFPYAHIDSVVQTRLIRPSVIKLLYNNNVLAKMQRQPVGDWEQIISSNIANEPVAMYGSSEAQGCPKLQLKHIWHLITRKMLEEGLQPEEIALEDAFVPNNHINVQQRAVNEAIFRNNNNLYYWLPMFLSIGYWPPVLLPKSEVYDSGCFTTQSGQQRVFGVGNRSSDDIDESDMQLAERMISMINKQRFLREAFWIDIGKALYMSDEGGENGLLSWIRHTEHSLKEVVNSESGASSASRPPGLPCFMRTTETIADTCRNLYYTFGNSSITVKSLAWYAREDSPYIYSYWHREWCMSSMENALSGLFTDVAITLYRVYWLDFVYCKGKWFQFKNHRWFEINQGIELHKCLSNDFVKRFEATSKMLSRQIDDSDDDTSKINGEITIQKITELIRRLETITFKNCIMKEASELFSDDRFLDLLDINPELTGVINGILQVSNHHIVFRDAKPEDYVSMCTNILYDTTYTWQHPLVQECIKWFGQVFTDRSLLHYFLKFSASCLNGSNSDEIVPIWTGDRDSSKSMIVKLFEKTFNSYCIKLPVGMLSEKAMNVSGLTSKRAKATRVAFLDDSEDDVPMHRCSSLSQDNDYNIQVPCKMILMRNKFPFKMIQVRNKVPIIPNADRAIKHCTRLIPFISTWVDDPPDDEPEQYSQRKFRKNPIFERRIPILSTAFLWIMCQYYPYYSTEGLVDPLIVTKTTEAYWHDTDVYAQFAADTIKEVYTEGGDRDATACVTLPEIYSEFTLWFSDVFPGTKVPEQSVVRAELSSRWGRMYNNAWHGICIIPALGSTNITASLGPTTSTPTK